MSDWILFSRKTASCIECVLSFAAAAVFSSPARYGNPCYFSLSKGFSNKHGPLTSSHRPTLTLLQLKSLSLNNTVHNIIGSYPVHPGHSIDFKWCHTTSSQLDLQGVKKQPDRKQKHTSMLQESGHFTNDGELLTR